MKLKRMTLENFRGYKSPVSVTFDNMTAFIGKNDAGKSTILEALDIFFNDGKGLIKLDKKDINIDNQGTDLNEIRISLSFSELPKKIIIDETNETELSKEYLLNKYGELEIIKLLKPTDGKPTVKTFIRANHPANPNCKDLLLKKNKELAKITMELGIECNKVKNAEMRAAIWKYYHDDLQLEEYEIDVSTKDSDIKSVWEKLQTYLPYYSLFQSDRKNTDSDDEVQDPLKEAVKQILSSEELREQLRHIAEKVKRKLQEVSDLTLEKIKEINPEIANTLHPNIPSPESLKWGDVFKGLSIYGDDIPINKRGSGVKRLILLNFFRAQAEKKKDEITPGQPVDLGLSVKWASWNVGASSPEEYGGYYAWGELNEKSDYQWDTYQYYDKENFECKFIGNNISGTQYDVARVKWGGSWRMPTLAECQELIDKCTWTWIIYKGVEGNKVTGPNGNSIFLPAAGSRAGTGASDQGLFGVYQSGTFYEGYGGGCYAYTLNSYHRGAYTYGESYRHFGHSVRPVSE